MPTSKRGRACDACHSIKIKCELGAAGGDPPCQRCLRLGKDCVVSVPKSQKDRIAELEARLEVVTNLLEAQSVNDVERTPAQLATPSLFSENGEGGAIKSKKRRLDTVLSNGSSGDVGANLSNEDVNGLGSLEIDRVISCKMQEQCLTRYRTELETVFPLVVPKDYNDLRETYPRTLQAVVFAACPGVVSLRLQDEVTNIVMKLLTSPAIEEAKKSIDLVQALLIAAYWYRQPKANIQVALPRLNHLATDIAKRNGLDKLYSFNPIESPVSGEQFNSGVPWRTWVLCDILYASIGICFRVPHQICWDGEYEAKLCLLEYGKSGLSTDPLLCQFLRAERLCEQITFQAGLVSDSDSLLQGADHATSRRLQNLITDWKVQIPLSLSCPRLDFYEYTAKIYVHEHILHTLTNTRSFAGPFVAERLSVTDIPTPVITPEHITSIYQLRDACHSLLVLFLNFDVTTIIALPATIFTARALYAQWILIKLYIAATASRNTFGNFIDAQSLKLEEYLRKMVEVSGKVHAVDDTCGSAKILMAPRRLREWFWNYNASHLRREVFAVNDYPTLDTTENENVVYGNPNDLDWTIFAPNDAFGYGFEDLFGSESYHNEALS